MGMKHRRGFAMIGMMNGGGVKQVKSLDETAQELSRIKKTHGGSPGALKPATLTERNTKTGKSRSITVEPTMAYGPGTGGKRRKK